MADFATPNLPSRDFDVTEEFFAQLGFGRVYREDRWMILRYGQAWLEFFPYPDLVPEESLFSCCLRLDDLDSPITQCRAVRSLEKNSGYPWLVEPRGEESGLTIAYLADPDGTLVRLIQNPAE